ncbi:MAG: ABC transporter permease subunit [Pseudomonadota bacterium]|nr:ABC transporter permease subunit [Pseudomonadota bacterium]
MILTIARNELRRMFLSPLAWTILAVVMLILAFMFLNNVQYFITIQSRLLSMGSDDGVTAVIAAPLLGNAAVVLLLVVPLLSMRLVADERRNKTLSLLVSAPVSMTEIILGKYLSLVAFLWLILALVAMMPLSLLAGGTLDFGLLGAGLFGLALLLAGFAAVGLFMSTLTQNQTVAAVSSFGVLLLFWILDWAGQGSGTSGILGYLSILNHYEPFLRGIFDTSDAAYLVLFILTFLMLSIRRLDMDRLGG